MAEITPSTFVRWTKRKWRMPGLLSSTSETSDVRIGRIGAERVVCGKEQSLASIFYPNGPTRTAILHFVSDGLTLAAFSAGSGEHPVAGIGTSVSFVMPRSSLVEAWPDLFSEDLGVNSHKTGGSPISGASVRRPSDHTSQHNLSHQNATFVHSPKPRAVRQSWP